ncbi:MAG: biotin--[acetyl-CoA-carboxylase] ligase, partial [Chitinophagaceae bacterium]|nr:biotin--[acetyl-CoA-carboxylase] ligase [Chitinophagaceae bacterium]
MLASVDSTNNYATAQVREGLATHGSAFMTLEQTQGRGQRGKTWLTTPGENILLTIIMRAEPMDVINPFVLSAKAALGCYDFFKDWAGPDMTRIKWPNDLYWQDRKAGGILIESISGSAGPDKSLLFDVGIGININLNILDQKVRNPVSLKQ